jgi:hypothetical protein
MAFLGMRGTGDWVANERPENWRQGILRLYPNGTAPLTAILSKMAEEKVDDPAFHWWTKGLPTQAGPIIGTFIDPALAIPYVAGGVIGNILYVQVAQITAEHFRAGHQALFRLNTDYDLDCNAEVVSVVLAGANSVITVRLIEDDDNSALNTIAGANRLLIVGNANAEGAAMPDAVAYDPIEWFNYTQIFRTPLSITRTARRTRLRTADAYKEAKREALELHSIEMEKAFLWGQRYQTIGANGKPKRFTMGIINAIRFGVDGVNGMGTMSNYTNTVVPGTTWLQGGENWIDTQLEVIFRYGSRSKLALCGSGAVLGIQRLVKNTASYNIEKGEAEYGIKVLEWLTAFGVINMIIHPLFSFEPTNRNSMVILEPSNIKFRYIDDTTFYPDADKQNTGRGRIDGTDEEYLTEAGLEFHHPAAWAYLNEFNTDA